MKSEHSEPDHLNVVKMVWVKSEKWKIKSEKWKMKSEHSEPDHLNVVKMIWVESGKLKEEIKSQIIKDRLRNIFSKKPKSIAKIFEHLIKRSKSV
jgi:hypothetical protein